MQLFISYARGDSTLVKLIRQDIERPRVAVWYDSRLYGGQDWWDEILHQIELCDVFLYVLSNRSIRSKACETELAYAVALERFIVGVQVDSVPISYAPEVIARSQVVDYTRRLDQEDQVSTVLSLRNSLDESPLAKKDLPDPRPARPGRPRSPI